MDAYTVLFADDEEEVIQVMMKKLDWASLGFQVVGIANNGVKALELVEELLPDVVMTDIKMPYMDGMELAHRIKTEFPDTKILIFTGFDEFEYAKEAVHLEIEEYILKPVNALELTQVFTNMKHKLDLEIHEKRNVQILQDYYLKSLPLLQANFYSTLLAGSIQEEELSRYLSDYRISFPGPFFCCAVVHTSLSQVPETMNALLLTTSIQKQAEERLGEKWRAKCFSYLGNIILIIQLKDENEVSELTDECDRFCRYVHRILGAVVTVGIGQVCKHILELSRSYDSAREAVSYRAIYGASRAINIKEVSPGETRVSATASDVELSSLFKTIRLGPGEAVLKAVKEYTEHLFASAKSLKQHHASIMELMSALYRFSVNNDIELEGESKDLRQMYINLLDLEREELQAWLTDVSLCCHRRLLQARSSSTKSFVTKAKDYIRQNYQEEELSLDYICETLGVSNAYFSTIFKKETGKSFVGYLTDYRMERAARLLIETNDKSYVIGKQVGYSDPNYFSYVFKRRFGVSPSKYRTEHEQREA